MKVYLNLICHNSQKKFFDKAIENLKREQAYMNEMVINVQKYWKEKECVQFNIELYYEKYEKEIVKKVIEYIRFEQEEVKLDETQDYIELSVYASIPEMVDNRKVFFTAFISKYE